MAAGKATLAAELKSILDFKKKIANYFSLYVCGGHRRMECSEYMSGTGCLFCRFNLIGCRLISDPFLEYE